ncbi:MAG TPA: coenzyme F420-0:L-glutamate ligase [Chloroflexota bacterium]
MLSLIPIPGIPLVERGDSVPDLVVEAARLAGIVFASGDVLVIAQKIISKAEGRVVSLRAVLPSETAQQLALETEKDPRLIELILQESREIVRARKGVIVVEDRRGFVCANAGIDRSNVQQQGGGDQVALLPLDPDASAQTIREVLHNRTGATVAVIVNDSHGRAFREGTVGVAIGIAGLPATVDRQGDRDLTGYTLQHTVIGLADEIAAAASLLMGPAAEGIPAVLVRGLQLPAAEGSASDLQRPRHTDLFR